jgi:MYXO-CTERM domain-containing protein
MNVNVPVGPGFDELFTGEDVLDETFQHSTPGTALGIGSLMVTTSQGVGRLPLNVTYQLVGNPSGLASTVNLRQTLDYDCTTGILTSQLCPVHPVTAPAASWPWLVLLAALLLATALRRRQHLRHA